MKIVVTGAKGQAGQAISHLAASNDIEVVELSHSDLDIASRNDVFAMINAVSPDVIINAAAMTNVDACETSISDAFAINALGVRNLAQAAESINAHLVHLSTDFVFDGNITRPYTEFDLARPLSVYGTSKLAGDTEALSYQMSTVLRVAWVFGDLHNDFFAWVANGVKEGTISALIDDQIGTPTYSYDLAQVVLDCIRGRIMGLINVANAGETTRLDMGQAICDKLGIDIRLDPIKAEDLKRPAPRPAYSALSTNTLLRITSREMRTWRDALDDRISRMR